MEIRYVENNDKESWYKYDQHLSEEEFKNKVLSKRGYVLLENNKIIGVLRYNLFWDNIPFCTLLFIDFKYHKKGYGRKMMKFWEEEMKSKGYGMVLTSTQIDEESQHFYRKLGYKDCGSLDITIPKYAQPLEIILSKET